MAGRDQSIPGEEALPSCLASRGGVRSGLGLTLGSYLLRYRLHFERDSREEVEKRKRAAREQVLQPVSPELLELDIREVYQPGSGE